MCIAKLRRFYNALTWVAIEVFHQKQYNTIHTHFPPIVNKGHSKHDKTKLKKTQLLQTPEVHNIHDNDDENERQIIHQVVRKWNTHHVWNQYKWLGLIYSFTYLFICFVDDLQCKADAVRRNTSLPFMLISFFYWMVSVDILIEVNIYQWWYLPLW